jgi:hypothetical protein
MLAHRILEALRQAKGEKCVSFAFPGGVDQPAGKGARCRLLDKQSRERFNTFFRSTGTASDNHLLSPVRFARGERPWIFAELCHADTGDVDILHGPFNFIPATGSCQDEELWQTFGAAFIQQAAISLDRNNKTTIWVSELTQWQSSVSYHRRLGWNFTGSVAVSHCCFFPRW